jgi:AAA domain-containing protein
MLQDFNPVGPGSNLVTTREVLAEEAALLAAVKAGQGAYAELGCGGQWKVLSPFVAGNEDQTNAVLHVLKSRDLVTSIRGRAGSGKTTIMQEAVRAVAALSGKDVFVVAPLGTRFNRFQVKGPPMQKPITMNLRARRTGRQR